MEIINSSLNLMSPTHFCNEWCAQKLKIALYEHPKMKYGLSVNLVKLHHHLIQVNKQMYHSQIPNDI